MVHLQICSKSALAFQAELNAEWYTASELEQMGAPSLMDCEREFKNKGGRLFVFQKENDVLQGSFSFRFNDHVYPICSAGNCRSQVLYHVLAPHAKRGFFQLHSPHASRKGYDPYHGNIPFEFQDQKEDEFVQAFGHSKIEPFGFADIQRQIGTSAHWNCTMMDAIRSYYDRHFYAPKIATNRVYIAFMRPVHAVLKRLNETHPDLSSVALVAIPLDDEISHVPVNVSFKRRSVEAYKTFEAKLLPLFQFEKEIEK